MKKCIIMCIISLSLLFLVSCKSVESAPQPSDKSIDISDLDLSDYNSLTDEFLTPIAISIIASANWATPDDIPADNFVSFYAVKALPDERNLDKEDIISAADYEGFIQQYFTVKSEHLKSSPKYDARKNQYKIGYLGSGASFAVTGANMEGDLLSLNYKYYSASDDTTVIRIGTAKIAINGDSYKYISCNSEEIE